MAAVLLPVGLTVYGVAAVVIPTVMFTNPAVVRERANAGAACVLAVVLVARAGLAAARASMPRRYRGGHRA